MLTGKRKYGILGIEKQEGGIVYGECTGEKHKGGSLSVSYGQFYSFYDYFCEWGGMARLFI